jgi:hypothetical protein
MTATRSTGHSSDDPGPAAARPGGTRVGGALRVPDHPHTPWTSSALDVRVVGNASGEEDGGGASGSRPGGGLDGGRHAVGRSGIGVVLPEVVGRQRWETESTAGDVRLLVWISRVSVRDGGGGCAALRDVSAEVEGEVAEAGAGRACRVVAGARESGQGVLDHRTRRSGDRAATPASTAANAGTRPRGRDRRAGDALRAQPAHVGPLGADRARVPGTRASANAGRPALQRGDLRPDPRGSEALPRPRPAVGRAPGRDRDRVQPQVHAAAQGDHLGLRPVVLRARAVLCRERAARGAGDRAGQGRAPDRIRRQAQGRSLAGLDGASKAAIRQAVDRAGRVAT